MIQNWTGYEGRLAGAWHLDSFLGERDGKGFFMTTNPADSSQALVEIIPADATSAGAVRASWDLARRFAHDHLMRVYETGETTLDDAKAYWAVLQLPDDDISEILTNRALNVHEARSMVSAAASALDHLHQRDLRHGAVTPANVFLVGKAFKLGADTIGPADEGGRESDIRQLGRTLVQAITQKDDSAVSQLPPPFREIAAGCLGPAVREWTPAHILDTLSGKRAAAPAPNAARLRLPIAAAAVVMVALLGYWFMRTPAEPEAPPVKKVEQAAAGPVVAAPLKPSPITPSRSRSAVERPTERQAERQRDSPSGKPSWAVIAATYNGFGGAQHRADQIAKISPQLRTHVYPPDGQGQTYYVVLGSGLTQAAAQELRDRARELGAPRDTYITKLTEN
jgi:hypothetical protein